jgi:glucose/arabinose dehydrogenase
MKKQLAVSTLAAMVVAACNSGGNSTPMPPVGPVPNVDLNVVQAFPALQFAAPVLLLQAPADDSRWYVVEQDGLVRTFINDDAVSDSSIFIDIRSRVASPVDQAGGETGLLGMAFHPNYPTDPRLYLSYTALQQNQLISRISEFQLDSTSERILLEVAQPESNHNGGGIQFGPDGFLYIGFGDGGGGGDAHGQIGNGQDLTTLLGKMLRIDIDRNNDSQPYLIPTDNPYAANATCGITVQSDTPCAEIFAYGFRNPWRWSFDRQTDELWVADVGQNAVEEVNRVVSGGNYGWRCLEGTDDFNPDCGTASDLLAPVVQYRREAGISVTGGYVYYGSELAALRERYVFGDLNGRLWSIPRDTAATVEVTAADVSETNLQLVSFAEDQDGEIYLVNYAGTLHRLD